MNLSIKEAAERLGFHPNTVRNLIKSGKIEAEKDASGYWVISEKAVQQFAGKWSAASEEEEARVIGKLFILEQINAKIDLQQQFIREHLKGLKQSKIGDQLDGLYDALAEVKFLTAAKRLVESIAIPSAAQIEWPGEPVEGDNE